MSNYARRSRLVSILLGLTATALAIGASAQPPSTFAELHWRCIGPFRGGRVLAVTGVPGEPLHWYFGAVDGGVWETRDAGRTWQPIFDREPVASIGAIAVAPSDPRVIYVGTGEADMRSDIAQGDGVYRSDDGGRSWSHVGLDDTRQIAAVLVDPQNPQIAFVAALGHPYGPNAERGVFKTTDGGRHWRKVLYRGVDTGAVSLAFQPGDANVIYAALWQTRRPPWNVYPPSSGPGGGLYKSTDGGEHWRRIGADGLPAHPGRIGLALSPAAPRRVYALVDATAGGLYRSDDAGAHWRRVSADPRIWQRGWYFTGITADPRDADRVWVMNTIVLRSDDGGGRFLAEKGDPTGDDFHALWIDPSAPERRILGVDQGVLITLNGGRSWSSWFNQPTAQIYHVATDDRFPYDVYGAQQDSGAVMLPSRTVSADGIAMPQFHEITAGGESDSIAPDPLDPQLIFGGRVDRLDLRTEQTRSVDPTLADPDIQRGTWTLPLVFSPKDPRRLYFGNQRLYETRDRGLSWRVVSADLARADPGSPPNLDPATAADNLGRGPRRGVIYSIAPSRTDADEVWAGTDDGLVWVTRDDGAHWRDATPPGVGPWSKIASIDASHFDADTAYVAVDRHRLDDDRPYVYRTHDRGRTWTLVVAGLPAGDFVNVVREDTRRHGLLYAGTEHGIYVSFDDGGHWQSLRLDLPVTSVRDIDVHGDDLVIATHGRGFWILDDVAPLREIGPRLAKAQAWLFTPAPAVRLRMPDFIGTPMPAEEPKGANPPNGAYLDYWLRGEQASPVELEVRDARGSLIDHWSSAQRAAPPDPSKIDVAPEWVVNPASPSAGAGAHRFVWDFKVRPPHGLTRADAVWAPPGTYVATLTVGGLRLSRSLRIVADPRVHLAPADYAAQFALATRVDDARAGVARAMTSAQALRAALTRARASAVGVDARRIDDLVARVDALIGRAPPPNPNDGFAFPPGSTETLQFATDALAGLFTAVDGADVAPDEAMHAGWTRLEPLAARVVAAEHELATTALDEENRARRAAGAAPIELPAGSP
ncbi:MAG: hypothetical protein KGL34_09605 [Gammaproteobacteria bacterium]|nr:hypothetical protein [Gammaproteobacteria bacterium]